MYRVLGTMGLDANILNENGQKKKRMTQRGMLTVAVRTEKDPSYFEHMGRKN